MKVLSIVGACLVLGVGVVGLTIAYVQGARGDWLSSLQTLKGIQVLTVACVAAIIAVSLGRWLSVRMS